MNKPGPRKNPNHCQEDQSDLEFLSLALETLSDFPPDADIFAFVLQSIQKIVGAEDVILVNSFDSDTRSVTLRSMTGVEPWRDQIEGLLGCPLERLSFIIPRNADIPLQRGGFDELHGGLSTLTFGHIPEDVCRKIERLPFFGRIYGTGISWKGHLHGSVVIIRPPGRELEREGIISLFIRQVSGYLRRKTAETKVIEQYATLRGIIDSADAPIFSLDREYRYTSFNASHAAVMKALYGADIEIGDSLVDSMTVEEDRAGAKKTIDRALAGEQVTIEEYSGEDARVRLVFEISHNPVRDAGGAIIGVAIFARDITQRRKAELALRESEATAKALIDATTESALLIEETGTVLAANKVTAQRIGSTVDDIIGRDVYSIIPPNLAESRRNKVQIARETGRPVRFEDVRSGRIIENSVYPVRDADGNIFRYAIYGRDITQERSALSALQQSEGRLKLALQASNLGIWTWNLQTDERQVFMGQQEIVGYSEGELEEYFRNIELLAHPLDRRTDGDLPQTIRQSESSDSQEFELRIRDKTGDWKTLLIRGNVISRGSEGKPLLIMGTFRDITENKKAIDQILTISVLKEQLLATTGLNAQIKLVCDAIVDIFHADFARIWMTDEGDLCSSGCIHAGITTGPDVCRTRAQCLHLIASSGRYTHIDGGHRRVPLGCYKIGRVASGEDPFFITNDVTHDSRVHDHAWAESLGLVSFAGFRILSLDQHPAGVLALFRSTPILPREEELLADLASTLSHVISSGVAARALEASEEKFRMFADYTYDWEYWIAEDSTMVYSSPSCERITGYPQGAFYTNPGLETELVLPDDRQIWLDHRVHAAASEKAESVDFRIRHCDGSIRWIAHSCQPINGTAGDRLGRRASSRDITRRKEIEEALRESETRYRSFVQSFQGIAYLSASNWTPIFFHGAVEEITGYTESDFISGNPRWDQVILPEDLTVIIERDNDRLVNESGCCIQREYRIRRKDGEVRWLADHIQNWIDDMGDLVLSGILTDITERKQIEEVLRESEKRYRDMFEINNAVMLILDPATGTITDANAAAVRYYRYSREEMRGMHISTINTKQKNEIRTAIAHAGSCDGAVFHFQHRKKNGEIRDVEVFSARIVSNGKNLLHSIIQDITERKRAEEALRLANRKMNLLSGITRHDISNQLIVLSGFLEISKDTLSDPAVTAEFIAREEKIAETIASQISFTKDYENLGVRDPTWQKVSSIIQTIITRLPMRNVTVDTDDCSLDLFADPLVEKVFYNLIDNALKYGGEKMTTIRVSNRGEMDRMIITVEDDGDGISHDDKGKLFTKGFGKHTGLGLYLSKEILSITGITITETGEPGKGARFEISVPEGAWRFGNKEQFRW